MQNHRSHACYVKNDLLTRGQDSYSCVEDFFVQSCARVGFYWQAYTCILFSLSPFRRRMLILNSYESIKDALVRQSALVSDRPSVWPFTYVNKNRRNVGNLGLNSLFSKFVGSRSRALKFVCACTHFIWMKSLFLRTDQKGHFGNNFDLDTFE